MRYQKLLLFFLIGIKLLSSQEAMSKEYFISPHGSDNSSGLTKESALQTINCGLLRAETGDIITVLPGIYQESIDLKLKNSITLRSSEKEKAVLSGSLPLEHFEKVPDTHNVYVCMFPKVPYEIKELDTNSYLASKSNVDSVIITDGSFFYDTENSKLYIQTSDGQSPEKHTIEAQVFEYGIQAQSALKDAVLEGFVIDGFVVHGYAKEGIKIRWSSKCVVKNCRVYDCGNGIRFYTTNNSEVADCITYRNGDSSPLSEGGNIMFYGNNMADCAIRRCIAFDSRHHAIRYYGGPLPEVKAIAENNLTYNNSKGGVWFKSKSLNKYGTAHNNVCIGEDYPIGSSCCLLRASIKNYNTQIPTNNSLLIRKTDDFSKDTPSAAASKLASGLGTGDTQVNIKEIKKAKFVDHIKHDYRLQADSPLRHAGPDGTDLGAFQYKSDVFFVSQDGNDSNEGTCMAKAWKSISHACKKLKAGETVYILKGVYNESISPEQSGEKGKPIIFRTHGDDDVIIFGINLNKKAYIVIDGFKMTGNSENGLSVCYSNNITISDCVVAENAHMGCEIKGSADITVSRNTFWNNTEWELSVTEKSKNITVDSNVIVGKEQGIRISDDSYDGLYCNYNCYFSSEKLKFSNGKSIFSDLSDWQKVTGWDEKSIFCNPCLSEPKKGNYRPEYGSPLINRGRFALGIGAKKPMPSLPLLFQMKDLRIHTLTPTTATITWQTPGIRSSSTIYWGKSPESMDSKREIKNIQKSFHRICLLNLVPKTTYYFKVESCNIKGSKKAYARSSVMQFTTPEFEEQSRTFYVSPSGHDTSDGLSSQTAWKTPSHAAMNVRTGDIVIFKEGTYPGDLEPFSSGTAQRPIIFRAEEGKRAILQGSTNANIPACVRLEGVEYITLEGFNFIGGTINFQVGINFSDHINIKKCILGRGIDYTRRRALTVANTNNLHIEDTVFSISEWPMAMSDNPEMTVTYRNCHFGIHGFTNFYAPKCKKIIVRNCIFMSNCEMKSSSLPEIFVKDIKCLDSDFNLFWFMPYDKWLYIAGEGNDFWPYSPYKNKWTGFKNWQSTGNDVHSLSTQNAYLNRYSGFFASPSVSIYCYEDFIPAENSPAMKSGENGEDIGVRPYAGFKRKTKGIQAMENPN